MIENKLNTENISDHITMYEATRSFTASREGINNTPGSEQIIKMKLLAKYIFEPLRKGLGGFPITISIFFRCLLLNIKVGGAKRSQHKAEKGAAIDLDVDRSNKLYNYQLFEYIRIHLPFDQLIWEFGTNLNPAWVHVSYNHGKNRGQILVAYKEQVGKEMVTKYKTYKEAA